MQSEIKVQMESLKLSITKLGLVQWASPSIGSLGALRLKAFLRIFERDTHLSQTTITPVMRYSFLVSRVEVRHR